MELAELQGSILRLKTTHGYFWMHDSVVFPLVKQRTFCWSSFSSFFSIVTESAPSSRACFTLSWPVDLPIAKMAWLNGWSSCFNQLQPCSPQDWKIWSWPRLPPNSWGCHGGHGNRPWRERDSLQTFSQCPFPCPLMGPGQVMPCHAKSSSWHPSTEALCSR